MTHEQAEAQVREDCRKDCRALLCELNERCMALLYDTPGFYERIRALEAIKKNPGEEVTGAADQGFRGS
jgi:hypothetical protein